LKKGKRREETAGIANDFDKCDALGPADLVWRRHVTPAGLVETVIERIEKDLETRMITAGIDIGHQSVNAVILDQDTIVSRATLVLAGEVEAAAKAVLERVLQQAEMKRDAIARVYTTGVGREKVGFADGHGTEMLAHVTGAHRLFPAARTVIDVGAEGSRIMRCDANGKLSNFAMNDKCASGAGVFLETVAQMLRVPVSEIGHASLKSTKQVVLTTTCAVFAESEIVAEIHKGSSKEDILWGVHESVASKIASVVKRVGVEEEVVFTGGVGRNVGLVKALEKQLGHAIRVPEHPETVGALGAAILAAR